MSILMGKFGVIFLAAIISAIISILGLLSAALMTNDIPKELLDVIWNILDIQNILLVFSLLIPLTIFFAAALLSLSIYAKTFKEAQNIITPLSFMVIIPSAVGMMPGIKLTAKSALIPILNISLATKDIISGTVKWGLFAEVYISLIVLAGVALFICAKWFERESTMFRG